MQGRISKVIVNVLFYEKELFVTVGDRRHILKFEAADSGKGVEQNTFTQQIQLPVFAAQTLSPEGEKGSVTRENVILPSDPQLMDQLICPGTDKADVQIGKICASSKVVGHRRQQQKQISGGEGADVSPAVDLTAAPGYQAQLVVCR